LDVSTLLPGIQLTMRSSRPPQMTIQYEYGKHRHGIFRQIRLRCRPSPCSVHLCVRTEDRFLVTFLYLSEIIVYIACCFLPLLILYPSWHCSLAHITFSLILTHITLAFHCHICPHRYFQPFSIFLVEPNPHEYFLPCFLFSDNFIPVLDSP
jgi:hypothetical protein